MGDDRHALIAFFRLDDHLHRLANAPRDAILTQLKLAWWRDAIGELGTRTVPGHPLLEEVSECLGGMGSELAGLVDGWEMVAVGDAIFEAADKLARARTDVVVRVIHSAGYLGTAVANWTAFELSQSVDNESDRVGLLDRVRGADDREPLPRRLRPFAILDSLARRAVRKNSPWLLGDRLSPLAAMRLGIFGR